MTKIAAKEFRFDFDQRQLFDQLNFSLEEQRIGVIGRNGSGKSTLARLIAGLIKPSGGEILVDGINLYEDRIEALKRVGIVFQNPDQQIIFPTVIEELKFGFAQQGDKSAEARADAILEKYGKSNWRDRLITHLSQGQRHFLALISILEMNPEILILDEPFTGLDIPTVMRLKEVLADFKGMIIHITHDPNLIADYDRAIWIEAGNIESDGKPDTVISQYQKAMTSMGASDAFTGF